MPKVYSGYKAMREMWCHAVGPSDQLSWSDVQPKLLALGIEPSSSLVEILARESRFYKEYDILTVHDLPQLYILLRLREPDSLQLPAPVKDATSTLLHSLLLFKSAATGRLNKAEVEEVIMAGSNHGVKNQKGKQPEVHRSKHKIVSALFKSLRWDPGMNTVCISQFLEGMMRVAETEFSEEEQDDDEEAAGTDAFFSGNTIVMGNADGLTQVIPSSSMLVKQGSLAKATSLFKQGSLRVSSSPSQKTSLDQARALAKSLSLNYHAGVPKRSSLKKVSSIASDHGHHEFSGPQLELQDAGATAVGTRATRLTSGSGAYGSFMTGSGGAIIS